MTKQTANDLIRIAAVPTSDRGDAWLAETAKAVLVAWRDGREIWIPRSQISIVETTPGEPQFGKSYAIPRWLAARNYMLF